MLILLYFKTLCPVYNDPFYSACVCNFDFLALQQQQNFLILLLLLLFVIIIYIYYTVTVVCSSNNNIYEKVVRYTPATVRRL